MYKGHHEQHNPIVGASLLDKLSFALLTVVMLFPVIDYFLRRVLQVAIVSSLWDDALLFAGLALTIVFWLSNKERKPAPLLNTAMLLFFLYGISLIVVNLTDFAVNLEGFRAVYEFILFFYVGFYLAKNYEQTRFLLSVATVLGALIGLHGIYQYIVGVPMPGHWTDSGEAVRTRAFSIIGSPNLLGSHMALLGPVAMGLFLSEKKNLYKLLWLGCTGAILGCLLLTLSRGAWLAFVGALGILGLFQDKRILAAGLVVVILAGVFVPAVNQRVTYMFSSEYMQKSSANGRINRWLTGYDQMRQDPFFGVGLGHFGGAVAKREYNSISVDNYYLGTVAEEGLVGLGLFLGILGISLKQGYNTWKTLPDKRERLLAASLLAGLLAVVLHNVVENIFESPYMTSYFWVMTGLLLAMPYTNTQGGGQVEEQ